jgi:flagellar hook-basal body complex protein FliE
MNLQLLKSAGAVQGAISPRAAGAAAPSQGVEFSKALNSALQGVSNTQNKADELAKQFQLENPNVSLEETMIAMQKAQLSFQSAVHVRNKLVSAYTDIMNMQV